MKSDWLDRIGNWNPQLFRELKGRLKPRNIAIAIVVTLALQLFLLFYHYNQLPLSPSYASPIGYCVSNEQGCIVNAMSDGWLIDWRKWWFDLFKWLSWLLPSILMAPAVYLLINDLDQEERRGTLNFIRLSPQPSRSILLGKLLGVPSLLYLAVATVIPLHLVSAVGAGAPIRFIFSFYLMLVAGCFFINSAALLCTALEKNITGAGKVQMDSGKALACILLTIFVLIPLYMVWNLKTTWSRFNHYLLGRAGDTWTYSGWQWFNFPLGENIAIAHIFSLTVLGLTTYWIWHALERRFNNPTATLLSKKQSYWVVACFEIVMIGFTFQWSLASTVPDSFAVPALLCTINLVGFFALIVALSPSRQSLLDWARFRRERSSNIGFWHHSLVQDLLWADKSPGLAAIALNGVLMVTVLAPWMFFWYKDNAQIQVLLGLVLCFNLILIYAAIAQLVMLVRSSKRAVLAVSAVKIAILLPIVLFAIVNRGLVGGHGYNLLLFSPALWVELNSASIPTLLLTALGEWIFLGLLCFQLTRRVKQLGASTSQPLLANSTKS